MAKNKSNQIDPEDELPPGFVALTRKNVDGWFVMEAGNVAQGIFRGSFKVPSQFNKKEGKTVLKIELTAEGCNAIGPDGEPGLLEEGQLVGIDQKGWLSGMDDVEEGVEVYIKCKGKGVAKKGQSEPWLFVVGRVPI